MLFKTSCVKRLKGFASSLKCEPYFLDCRALLMIKYASEFVAWLMLGRDTVLQGREFRVEEKSAGFYSEKCLLLLLCCNQLFLTNCNFSLIILPQTSYTLNWTHMTWPVWVILLFFVFCFSFIFCVLLQFEQLNWQFQFVLLLFLFCFFTAYCTMISLCVDVFSLYKLGNI